MITKPSGLRDTVNAVVACMDAGEGREQDAEALCAESSCPYSGRSVQLATVNNTQFDRWFNRSGIPASSTGMSELDETR